MEAGIPIGGYCPKGRLAEDGTVPECYPLIELDRGGYAARTEKNVIESDGTLILNIGELSGGTKLTVECAKKHGKPCLTVQLDTAPRMQGVLSWVKEYNSKVINIAGPRESKNPGGIHQQAANYLRHLFAAVREGA